VILWTATVLGCQSNAAMLSHRRIVGSPMRMDVAGIDGWMDGWLGVNGFG